MPHESSLPLMFLAAVPAAPDDLSWALTLANYGVAGLMLVYFIWRDKRTEERRDLERREANAIQRENTHALNLLTRGLMVEVMALRHADEAAHDLAAKVKEQAEAAVEARGK